MAEPPVPPVPSPPGPPDQDITITTHPLVAKLLGDSDPPGKYVTVVGYFGPSRTKGNVRLYLSHEFCAYLEIPTGGILSTEPVDRDDENSPTRVYLEKSTTVELVQVSSLSLEASFLEGSIASAFLPGAMDAEGGGVSLTLRPPFLSILCTIVPPYSNRTKCCIHTFIPRCHPVHGPDQRDEAMEPGEGIVPPQSNRTPCCPPPTPHC